MKHLLFAFAILAAMNFTFVNENPPADDPIVGIWRTIDDETGKPKSMVKMYLAKNGKYYGTITELLNRGADEDKDPTCTVCPKDDYRHGQKIIGMKIVSNLNKKGGEYTGGTILDPKTGKIYGCKMWVEGKDKLMVRGYLGPFYRTQTWERVQ
jgi:uncharacterized protein (DUF2147 family)